MDRTDLRRAVPPDEREEKRFARSGYPVPQPLGLPINSRSWLPLRRLASANSTNRADRRREKYKWEKPQSLMAVERGAFLLYERFAKIRNICRICDSLQSVGPA